MSIFCADSASCFGGADCKSYKNTLSCRITTQVKCNPVHTSKVKLLIAFNFATAAVAALVLFGASLFLPGVFRSSYIGLFRGC